MTMLADGLPGLVASLGPSLLAKATLTLLITLGAVRLARRRPASVRHLLLVAEFGTLLVMPIVIVLAPALRVEVVAAVPVMFEDYLVETVSLDDQAPTAASPLQTSVSRIGGWWTVATPELLTAIWIGGVLLCGMPLFIGMVQVRQLRRTGLPWRAGQRLVDSLAPEAGVRQSIDVLRHESVAAPATCGISRHTVLFPVDADTWKDEDILRAAVHEVEHVRRADCFVNLVARAVCAAYWFHPLVWVAWRRLRLEAERACDDAVLRWAEADAYADQLVTLAGRLSASARHPLLAMANRSDLVHRVKAVLDRRQARGQAGVAAVAGIAIAAAVLIVTLSPLQAVTGASAITAADQSRDVGPAPQFEVATIRINRSGERRARHAIVPASGQLTITNIAVNALIREAYDLPLPSQLVDVPDWARTTRVDVVAKAASPAPVTTLQRMLQPLLAEHFKLAVRREPRDMDVFAMVVANPGRLGPRLHRNDDACDDAVGTAGGFARAPEGAPNQEGTCGILPGGAGRIVARGLDMPGLAAFIGTVPGRIVIDRTGLTGRFDIDLTYTPSAFTAAALAQRPGAAPPPGVDPSGPPLITALREQLGLRLDPVRAPVEVLVIEHAEPLSVDEPAAGPAARAPQPSSTAFEVASIRQNTSGTGLPPRTGDPARQGARPRFDVASIRQCGPNVGRGGGPGSFSPRQITIDCQPVKGLIETAYLTYANGVTAQPQRVIRTPIEGGPGWITSDAFTISATTDREATFAMMHGPMLQTLLEERFRLKVRRETREIPVYALRVAGSGHKLKPFVEGSCVVREPDFTQPNPLAALAALPPLEPGQRRCMNRGMLKGSTRLVEADAITMSELTNFFIGPVDRPVIDRTGLTGTWVVHLEYAPTDRDRVLSATRGEPLESAAPSIFTALQEQLGLRLEPARGPGEYLVIETIERPTEN